MACATTTDQISMLHTFQI